MSENITLGDIFDIFNEIWPNPSNFWTILKVCSTKLLVHVGPKILPLLKILKKLMNSELLNHDEIDSWIPYSDAISDEEYATISYPSEIWNIVMNILTEFENKDTMDNCLSFPTTSQVPIGDIYTSSTTVVGQPALVDVQSSKDCLSSPDEDELFGPEESDEVSCYYFETL